MGDRGGGEGDIPVWESRRHFWLLFLGVKAAGRSFFPVPSFICLFFVAYFLVDFRVRLFPPDPRYFFAKVLELGSFLVSTR